MGEKRVFVGKHKGEDHLDGDLGIDRRIILQ
jgi:hypothetical protein